MTFHTVETRVGLYNKNFANIIDIPVGEQNTKEFSRKALNITVINDFDVQPCEFIPGQYYPRMARPTLINDRYLGKSGHGPLYMYAENMASTLPHDKIALANSVNQLSILIRELKVIIDRIHPSTTNLISFGHHT